MMRCAGDSILQLIAAVTNFQLRDYVAGGDTACVGSRWNKSPSRAAHPDVSMTLQAFDGVMPEVRPFGASSRCQLWRNLGHLSLTGINVPVNNVAGKATATRKSRHYVT